MKWIEHLKRKWNLRSSIQVILILVVFATTGFTVMFLKRPIVALFSAEEEQNWWFTIIYYLLILPVYNVFLLFYGFIFGQFSFFWNFEKRFFKRISGKE